MRLRLVAVTLGVSAALTFGTGAATAAQDYPGGTTEERVDPTKADRSEVLAETLTRGSAAEVAPAAATASAEAVLPVTGGDIVGLGVLGVGLVGVGTLAVRRSRRPATV